MQKLSTSLRYLLLLLIVFVEVGHARAETWPLRRQIDLSSGFGDFRQKRFHAGLDIRTGGKIGDQIFSPVDGYVWRVRTSYDGYGKGLYIKGHDGFLYVYGHLSRFADDISPVVQSEQLRTKRYYVDHYFPEDSLPVKAGQFIGYTGKTGSGAPHLHFEKRTADNRPLNPLSHGYVLTDKVPPVFTRIGFSQRDDHSLYADGSRSQYFSVSERKPGKYELDTMLYFNSPFGIAAECYDMMRAGGMQQAVHTITLYVDKKPYYSISYDTLDFAYGRLVDLNYDYLQAVDDRRRVQVLYRKPGNDYPGARALNGFDGVVGIEPPLSIGRHKATIVAEDAFGNTSELNFQFLWGPPEFVYVLDSTVKSDDESDDKNTTFYLSMTPGTDELDIKNVSVEVNEARRWETVKELTVRKHGSKLQVDAKGVGVLYHPLRLRLRTASGCEFVDNVFAGISSGPIKNPEINYEILEDGILFTVDPENLRSSDMVLRLYDQGKMIGVFPIKRFLNMKEYKFFVPADPKYIRIDRVDVSPNADMLMQNNFGRDLDIYLVGVEDRDISVDSTFVIHAPRQAFFSPEFITLEKHDISTRIQLRMNSDHYEIFPAAFLTREDLVVTCAVDSTAVSPDRTGICWLDVANNRWVWLTDNALNEQTLSAASQGGGSFAAMIDSKPPEISDLNIIDGRRYQNPRPPVQFKLDDNLSGIEDDRSIQVYIDDQWLIPEYDPESKVCMCTLANELDFGEHTLSIKVTDRAGNSTERRLTFTISPR